MLPARGAIFSATAACLVLVAAAAAAVPVFYNIVYVATDFAIGACLMVWLDKRKIYVHEPSSFGLVAGFMGEDGS